MSSQSQWIPAGSSSSASWRGEMGVQPAGHRYFSRPDGTFRVSGEAFHVSVTTVLSFYKAFTKEIESTPKLDPAHAVLQTLARTLDCWFWVAKSTDRGRLNQCSCRRSVFKGFTLALGKHVNRATLPCISHKST